MRSSPAYGGGAASADTGPVGPAPQPLLGRSLSEPRRDTVAVAEVPTRLPERNLDVLRAMAVSCVLVDHTVLTLGRGLPFIPIWDVGRAGVLFFFVHTALVLMSSLERQGPRGDWIRAFYIRRAFRIYPLAIATIIGIAALGLSPYVTTRVTWGASIPTNAPTLIADMALVQNLFGRPDILGVLWTLPVEVQLYVGLPWAFRLARRGAAGVAACLSGAVVLALIVAHVTLPGLWRLTAFEFAPCFMAGVLAYTILRHRPRAPVPGWMWVPILLACLPLFVVLRPTAAAPERGWLFTLGVGCAIPFVQELPHSWFTRVSHQICTHSYGIYLLHMPALWCAFSLLRPGTPPGIRWCVFGLLIVALPVVAYHLVEEPGIRLGKWLARRPDLRWRAIAVVH
jgi:peptidoglycan/LPS O-acetylase OafA/YrhL